MKFCSIGFHNFRNLSDSLIPTDARQVLLVGDNGQGKTNFLEAVYVLCYGSSFRALHTRDMIAHGKREFSLSAVVETDEGLHQQIGYYFGGGKREIRIDGKEIRDRRELMYNIPCIIYSHNDIEFIRGTPESRRRFFDQTMSMYNPLFFDDLRRYRLILRQRNAAIQGGYRALIPMYDDQLAAIGMTIQEQRREAVGEFNTILPGLYRTVSENNSEMRIVYRPSWGECMHADDAREKLARTLDRDIRMQTTASGIHRDQFLVMDGHVNFSLSGSTGQMRLASLIFRMVQTHAYRQKTGKDPVLLMDDVLLELDVAKRGLFLDQLGGYSQAMFTFLPGEQYFSRLSDEKSIMYHVKEGRVST